MSRTGNLDDLVFLLGTKYAKQVAKDNPQSIEALAKAMTILAGHLIGCAGLPAKDAIDWFKMGLRTGAAGFPIEVALNHLRKMPQSTTQKAPDLTAQQLGEKMFIALHDALPIDEQITVETATDAAAMSIVHFIRSVEIPLPYLIERLGISAVLVEHRLAHAAAAEAYQAIIN